MVGRTTFEFTICKSQYSQFSEKSYHLRGPWTFISVFLNHNFCCNLTDLEIELIERLMFSLNVVQLSSSTMDSRGWCLSLIGSFSVTSWPCPNLLI